MWGGDPRRLYASAQDWGQVLMIGGKSCSHGRAFTTPQKLLNIHAIYQVDPIVSGK
jgi:hypothetical protein